MIAAIVLALAQAAAPAATLPLSSAQRTAADRLLDATGAPTRRNAAIDEMVSRVFGFSLAKYEPVAASKPTPQCKSSDATAKEVRHDIDVARPALLAQITEVQERAYATRMSIAEMDAVTAFAATPAGQRFFDQAQPAAMEAATGARKIVLDHLITIIERVAIAHGDKTVTVETDK